MSTRYAISLWCYLHHADCPAVEGVLADLKQRGYGVELFSPWRSAEDLLAPEATARLKPLLEGMDVSIHTAGAHWPDGLKRHVAAAETVGAGVIVLHPSDVGLPDEPEHVNVEAVKQAVDYADGKGVRLALENGAFEFLAEAFGQVEGLGFCFDVGHPFMTGDSEGGEPFLESFGDRMIHVHLQDVQTDLEDMIWPGQVKWDHFTVGSGAIPQSFWDSLVATEDRIDYDGMWVFEIRPRTPLHEAEISREFLREFLAE
ncbi:MAG: sugar phosphate isomerase/epimerase family protein [Planctomycetota bacterium]|jgi:sugar phosphate isomerase/epimerase